MSDAQAPHLAIEDDLPLVDEVLGRWRDALGGDYDAYRNHVYRMVNFCFALRPCDEEERQKVLLAGCFHDLGIWSARTFDYLQPSVELAKAYLEQENLQAWSPEVTLMIDDHHKLRRYAEPAHPLVETFRRGDLVDFSLGWIRSGLTARYVTDVKKRFPNAGFHKRLVALELAWLPRHPLDPLPVLKW